MQLAYGLCISSQDFREESQSLEDECELTNDEVEQFFSAVGASENNDTSKIRPPFSNPYRANEYAKGGQHI